MFPSSLTETIKEFESMIVWKKSGGGCSDDIPEPQPGLDTEFDQVNSECDLEKHKIEEYLNYIKSLLVEKNPKQHAKVMRNVQFSNAKFRYEIEIPIELVEGKKKP